MSIEFERVNGVIRSVYPQFGGGHILADECKCVVRYEPMRVIRVLDCPVDEHKQEALNQSPATGV